MSIFWRTLRFQSVIIIIGYFSVSVANYVDWFVIHGMQVDEFGAKGVDFYGSMLGSFSFSLLGILSCALSLSGYLFFWKKISRLGIGLMAVFWSVVFWVLLLLLMKRSSTAFNQMILVSIVSASASLVSVMAVEALRKFRIVNLWPV